MATEAAEPFRPPVLDRLGRITIVANLVTCGLVFLLMILFGLLMRMTQAGWLALDPDLFYEIMTVHGTGMVGIAALGGATVMWYFLSRYVRLSSGVLAANLVLFVVGVVMILAADLLGGFAGAWTFLYPLPAISGGQWEAAAAFWHLLGLLLVGVGFLVLCLDIARGLIAGYGGLFGALGWPQLLGLSQRELPPPAVVASSMSVIVTALSLIAGALVIVLSMANLLVPEFTINPLFAKNLIYFFGHAFINATIYMAVIAVYELLPGYTGRAWKSSKPFLAGWMGSTIMVLVIFPHHLLMDFAMPEWAMIMAQILSYTNSFPALIVSGLGALAIVHRSGIKWDVVSGLLFVAMFGWMAGVVPAVIDATIVINAEMHNTLWVPGHFHFYLLLGVLPMILGFMYFLGRSTARLGAGSGDGWAYAVYVLGALGFVFMFLFSGRHSVPRRWAEHLPEWMPYDQAASVFAFLVLLAATWFVLRTLSGLGRFLAAK